MNEGDITLRSDTLRQCIARATGASPGAIKIHERCDRPLVIDRLAGGVSPGSIKLHEMMGPRQRDNSSRLVDQRADYFQLYVANLAMAARRNADLQAALASEALGATQSASHSSTISHF